MTKQEFDNLISGVDPNAKEKDAPKKSALLEKVEAMSEEEVVNLPLEDSQQVLRDIEAFNADRERYIGHVMTRPNLSPTEAKALSGEIARFFRENPL